MNKTEFPVEEPDSKLCQMPALKSTNQTLKQFTKTKYSS